MSLGENSLVAAYQGKGQLKSRPSGTWVVTIIFSIVLLFLFKGTSIPFRPVNVSATEVISPITVPLHQSYWYYAATGLPPDARSFYCTLSKIHHHHHRHRHCHEHVHEHEHEHEHDHEHEHEHEHDHEHHEHQHQHQHHLLQHHKLYVCYR